MKFLLKFNKNILAFLITAFLSLVIFFYNDSRQVKTVETAWQDFLVVISSPQQYYLDLLSSKQLVDSLKVEIVNLTNQNNNLLNLKEQIIELDKAIGLKEEIRKNIDSKVLLPCYVVKNNYMSSTSTLLISGGSNDDIKLNQPVIDFYGNLVGKVINVGKNSSKVQLITDKNFSVAVKIGNSSFAQFKPTYGKLGKLEGVVKSAIINKDIIIYSSNISDIYSPNIPICKVIDVSINEYELFQAVSVELLSNIESLSYVYVIQ